MTCRSRRLTPDMLHAAKEEFEEMNRAPTPELLALLFKRPFTWYRWRTKDGVPVKTALNVLDPRQCQVPNIPDFSHLLSGISVFSTIGLMKAYSQIRNTAKPRRLSGY
ncbi:hypothetical protein J437_LFUL006985 [Ladona fulva]|uniref:Uncharacterized protein n=1 Tax=Ladona fulva TaxID=123851 RepID=A0A8K0P1H3_LADFU|nr:hypothetical protein J437_LFUL006985 [Ladona fulva]